MGLLFSTAVDVSMGEPSPADSELTTVIMGTKEQRLQWRDFLSESISKSRACAMYASFDVDPCPAPYAKPPATLRTGSALAEPARQDSQRDLKLPSDALGPRSTH